MKEVSKILDKLGAITHGHFVGTSGRHMPIYLNKNLLLSNPKYVSKIGKLFAEKFKKSNIEVVVAPAVAGIALSQWTAYHLGKIYKKEVLSVYTEKTENNDQVFKRGYDLLVKYKNVLIVEDVVTTGSSVKKVIKSIKKAKGKLVSVCVMINKDPKIVNSKNIGAKLFSLEILNIESYKKDNCPLCNKGVLINTDLGHGAKFLSKKISKKK